MEAARQRGGPIVPVFIWAPAEEGDWPPGAASRSWLQESLGALETALRGVGLRLVLHRGGSVEALRRLVAETGAGAVFWNRRYEPVIRARDLAVETALGQQGVEVRSFNAALLHEPWTIQNRAGKPFQVFTPFWRHCLAQAEPLGPVPAPDHLLAPTRWPRSLGLPELELASRHSWTDGLRAAWRPGAAGAERQLAGFLDEGFAEYESGRDHPAQPGTSRLSPHLHFGEVSPRQVWAALRERAEREGWPLARWRQSQFLTEVGWREFAHHLLHHFPHTAREPLRPEFARFPWRQDAAGLKAWQRGRTGYPFVDAGLRQLWATGWMHNRVRMVVASFLVKDLLLPWQEGARWFWDTLVDADLAQNTLGWQWSAGCGADAAPFFRIFNPVGQGEKFDAAGDYVRRWVPELARVPTRWIHRPHEAPPEIRAQGVAPPFSAYPRPVVRHAIARGAAGLPRLPLKLRELLPIAGGRRGNGLGTGRMPPGMMRPTCRQHLKTCGCRLAAPWVVCPGRATLPWVSAVRPLRFPRRFIRSVRSRGRGERGQWCDSIEGSAALPSRNLALGGPVSLPCS